MPELDDDRSWHFDPIARLVRISFLLRQVGLILAFGTSSNVVLLLSTLVLGPVFYRYSMVAIAFSLTVLNIGMALWFETLRKRGDAIFEEVSDEFQWHIGKKYADSSGGETDLARPQLDVRLALRDFARSAELPLFPGRLGPAAYVAVNLVAPVFLISLLRVRM